MSQSAAAMSGRITDLTPTIVEHIPVGAEMEEGRLYISAEYEIAVHRCCCGCGSQVVTSTDASGWLLSFGANDTVTLTPSISNRFLCKSHYFITDNGVQWV